MICTVDSDSVTVTPQESAFLRDVVHPVAPTGVQRYVSKCFSNVEEFASPRDLAEHHKLLDANNVKYFGWKRTFYIIRNHRWALNWC